MLSVLSAGELSRRAHHELPVGPAFDRTGLRSLGPLRHSAAHEQPRHVPPGRQRTARSLPVSRRDPRWLRAPAVK